MIKQTVGDFVAVYNQLKKSLVAASSLSGPTARLRELERELGGLLHKVVSSHGSINQLSDIGISTMKEGLLSVDNATLDKAIEPGSSEGQTSELQTIMRNSFAVFFLKKKKYQNRI